MIPRVQVGQAEEAPPDTPSDEVTGCSPSRPSAPVSLILAIRCGLWVSHRKRAGRKRPNCSQNHCLSCPATIASQG